MRSDLEAMARAGLRADRSVLQLDEPAFTAVNQAADQLAAFPPAETLVDTLATLWTQHAFAPDVIDYLLLLAGRPAMGLPTKPAGNLRRALADKLREAIVCQCGAVMARQAQGEQLIDDYACSACGAALSVEWHALTPFYTVSA